MTLRELVARLADIAGVFEMPAAARMRIDDLCRDLGAPAGMLTHPLAAPMRGEWIPQPEVLVLDMDWFDRDPEATLDDPDPLQTLARDLGCYVIVTPGGKLESMSVDEALVALNALLMKKTTAPWPAPPEIPKGEEN